MSITSKQKVPILGEMQEGTDLLVYVPPITAPRVIADSPLAQADGWIHADMNTLKTEFAGGYAIGDNTHIVQGIGKPSPRAGVFAHNKALVVAVSIIAKINGTDPTPENNLKPQNR